MSWIETLAASIASSLAVTGLLLFFVKHYVQKQVDWNFKRLELEYESARAERDHVRQHYVTQRLGIYPEISQLVYRLRNALNDGMARPHIGEWDDEFSQLCGELTEGLFRWRYFLPKPLFELLHDFKRTAQDVLVFYDIRTRTGEVDNQQGYQLALERLRPVAERMNGLGEEITKAINLDAPPKAR